MKYQWAVIGAGPAGIAAVGKLLDHGIEAQQIAWVDPKFTVGDFGTHWRNVPSNTKVELFLKFLHNCQAFDFQNCPRDLALLSAQHNKTCYLSLMADSLQWVTHHLKQKVQAIHDFAENLVLSDRSWKVKLKNQSAIDATNVILAVGAEPKNLAFAKPAMIPLQDALDAQNIKNHVGPNDTVAVFGSSHSAILILRNLIESSVKQIINFYKDPLLYAVYFDDWILFDDTGLKGPTADWARHNLHEKLPHNLLRVYSNHENIEHYLPQCDKVIYSVGFERRALPIIEGLGHVKYIEQAGIIAPGLFGLGIAFPEAKYNPLGILEYRVGLWKFMDYLNRILPIWLKYSP